ELYVLNAGGSGNISGFTVDNSGRLTPIAGSTQPLSGSNVGPAQVSFSPDGRQLVVTEKTTNLLDVYSVDANGIASGPTTTPSAGGTPFGFAFGHRSDLFVSEAAGSASSYVLQPGGAQAIHAFHVEDDGRLTALGPIVGLPAGTRGLAAF